MSTCQPFSSQGPAGIADAVEKLDCAAAEATAASFGRLFGSSGNFATALTILLTLYVGFFALSLLTGRSSLRASVLTPKMLTLGLVLTFVTSWVAYQSVVWNLAVGGPDEIATVLVGSDGSATAAFAGRLDTLFERVGAAAEAAASQESAAPAFTAPSNILSLAAVIFLLGTVGVLAVCRLGLAALLILGPVFIVLALFEGTRGVFHGWLKSVALFALVPLLTVILGSGALYAIAPMVDGLAVAGEISLQTAVSILVASVVYVALMIAAFKIAGNLTRGWQLSHSAVPISSTHYEPPVAAAPASLRGGHARTSSARSERVQSVVAGLEANSVPSSVPVQRLASFQPIGFDRVKASPTPGQNAGDQRVEFRAKAKAPNTLPKELLK